MRYGKELELPNLIMMILSSVYCSKLSVYLPHRVNEDKGKAAWDGKKEILSISLPIIREDPF